MLLAIECAVLSVALALDGNGDSLEVRQEVQGLVHQGSVFGTERFPCVPAREGRSEAEQDINRREARAKGAC